MQTFATIAILKPIFYLLHNDIYITFNLSFFAVAVGKEGNDSVYFFYLSLISFSHSTIFISFSSCLMIISRIFWNSWRNSSFMSDLHILIAIYWFPSCVIITFISSFVSFNYFPMLYLLLTLFPLVFSIS